MLGVDNRYRLSYELLETHQFPWTDPSQPKSVMKRWSSEGPLRWFGHVWFAFRYCECCGVSQAMNSWKGEVIFGWPGPWMLLTLNTAVALKMLRDNGWRERERERERENEHMTVQRCVKSKSLKYVRGGSAPFLCNFCMKHEVKDSRVQTYC